MVYEKKNKIKKRYICPNCLKDFGNLKYQLELHLNRVNPCKKNTNNVDKNINNNNNDNDNTNGDLENYNDMILNFKPISKNNTILNNSENSKNIIYDILLNEEETNNKNISQSENLIYDLIKKMDFLIQQNEKMNQDIFNLNSEIIELKKDNNTFKNQIIRNSNSNNRNTQNNNHCVNINVNNFNDTNDFKGNFNNLLKETGKQIYLRTVENIFLNPSKPENHNIYIADKNRGYAKIYNDGRWKTENINIVDTIINKVVEYYKLSIEEIKKDTVKFEKIKSQINSKLHHLNNCDIEYLADLEDEQENDGTNNKGKINRWNEFREMVFRDIVNLFHDKKDIVLNTHKKNKVIVDKD